MLSKVRGQLTYANVMATLAIFIALGGSSYAAVQLRANSVGSRQIASNAVKSSEIARSAVESAEVRNGSLRAADFARLPAGPRGPAGARGTRGPQGDRGPTGPRGAAGADAATKLLVRLGTAVDVAAGASTTLMAFCEPGERAVSGGVSAPESEFAQVTSSFPGPNTEGSTPTSWSIRVRNQTTNPSSVQFQPYTVCVSP